MQNIICNLDKDIGIYHIEFNRENKLNAFTAEMFQYLKKCLRNAETNEDVSVILISGRGRAFSAGADLMSLASLEYMNKRDVIEILKQMYELGAVVHENIKPVISAVHGYAIGSGFAIAIASDILIMSRDAILRPGFIALGLNPEFCSSLLLPHIIGYKNAFKIFLFNEDIPAAKALEMGIAQYVADKDKLIDMAYEIAKKINELPNRAVYNTKKLLGKELVTSCFQIVEKEAILQEENIQTQEHKEWIMKYIESFKKS